MSEAFLLGVGVTPFGVHAARTHKDLAAEAVRAALADAGLAQGRVPLEAAYFGSCALSVFGQANLGGQVVLGPLQRGGDACLPERLPVVNVEAACATGAAALHGAVTAVRAGDLDLCLVVGVDKTIVPDDPFRTVGIFLGALDQLDPELWQEHYASQAAAAGLTFAPSKKRVVVLDAVALAAQAHMQAHGITREDLAHVASKNRGHGALNPLAQRRKPVSAEAVLSEEVLCGPFSKSMCAPIGDGAAAAIVCSRSFLQRAEQRARARAVEVAACVLGGGRFAPLGGEPAARSTAQRAYERAGLVPSQVSLAEVHDATAFAELRLCEALGFCEEGEAAAYARAGHTTLGGERPLNPSGGLVSKGHPLAATGIAQVAELAAQLRGEAGERQSREARIGLAHNGGGLLGFDEALCVVTIVRPA